MEVIWSIRALIFCIATAKAAAAETGATTITVTQEAPLKHVIEQFENLVLNTTEQALKVSTQVYGNLTKTMPPLLQQAIVPIIGEYIRAVDEALQCARNYSEQRRVLRYFRRSNIQLERLRQQLQPQYPKFEFYLLSNEFYDAGKTVTEFDNLYLEFMLAFQHLSEKVWDTIPAEALEQQPDFVEILQDIAREKKLSEKDKLYDEFIEMFLFKVETDAVENRQLE